MQTNPPPVPSGVLPQWPTQSSSISNAYSGSQHQRTASNPRAYPLPETGGPDPPVSGKKEENGQPYYTGNPENYPSYQQHNYGSVGMGGYNYGHPGMNSNLSAAYNTAASSPPAHSSSRRTSGPNARIATPPPGLLSTAHNTSPSTRYYQTPEMTHQHSPYQASSAPPQILSHHYNAMPGQPQSAHAYSQYPGYGQQSQQAPPQLQPPWNGYPGHGYSQQQHHQHHPQQQQPRSTSGQSHTTSTLPQIRSTHNPPSSRQVPSGAPAAFDHPSSSPAYQQWSGSDPLKSSGTTHQSQQPWQGSPQSARASQQLSHLSGQAPPGPQGPNQNSSPMISQGPWQGYPAMPGVPPHAVGPGHSMTGQPYWSSPQYGYYPPPPQNQLPVQGLAQPPNPNRAPSPPPQGLASLPAVQPVTPVTQKRKSTKSKKDSLKDKERVEDYPGLGKRPVEYESEEVHGDKKESSKKKKASKEEKESKDKDQEKEKEKPPPKAKSHLHPPKQAPSSWQLFFADELAKAKAVVHPEEKSPGGTVRPVKLNVAHVAKEAGSVYANLSEERKQYYADKVKEARLQHAIDMEAWRATLTPEDVRTENAFRAQQRKEGKSRKGNIKDPHAPKKPLSAYFLFLKAIRDTDHIRAQVWGGETETTKQSVLAAQKWRSLTDDEKKPYLEQAETDKQRYETARKQYEEDSAARARGEDIPIKKPFNVSSSPPKPPASIFAPRPELPSDSTSAVAPGSDSDLPDQSSTPMKIKSSPQHNQTPDPTLSNYHPTSPQESQYDPSAPIDMDEFRGFNDPLDLGLAGLSGIDGMVGNDTGGAWDELENLMGQEVIYSPAKLEPAAHIDTESVTAVTEAAPPSGLETADISVAPYLDEAVAETAAEVPSAGDSTGMVDEADVQRIAESAEGHLAVPPGLGHIKEERSEGLDVSAGSMESLYSEIKEEEGQESSAGTSAGDEL